MRDAEQIRKIINRYLVDIRYALDKAWYNEGLDLVMEGLQDIARLSQEVLRKVSGETQEDRGRGSR